MPFSPSEFEWWMWLLFSVGAGIVCIICALIGSRRNNETAEATFGVLAFLAGLTAGVCLLVAVIRFVKWVWAG